MQKIKYMIVFFSFSVASQALLLLSFGSFRRSKASDTVWCNPLMLFLFYQARPPSSANGSGPGWAEHRLRWVVLFYLFS